MPSPNQDVATKGATSMDGETTELRDWLLTQPAECNDCCGEGIDLKGNECAHCEGTGEEPADNEPA